MCNIIWEVCDFNYRVKMVMYIQKRTLEFNMLNLVINL